MNALTTHDLSNQWRQACALMQGDRITDLRKYQCLAAEKCQHALTSALANAQLCLRALHQMVKSSCDINLSIVAVSIRI